MTTPDRPGGIPDETWRAYLMVKGMIKKKQKPLNIRDVPSGVGNPTSFDDDGIGRSVGDDGTVHLWRWIGAVGQWGSIVYLGPEQVKATMPADDLAFDDAACQADNPASAVKQPITDRGIAEIMSNAMRKMGQPKREIAPLSRAIREAAMSYHDSSGCGVRTWVHLSPEEQEREFWQMYWAIKRYHEIMGSELG